MLVPGVVSRVLYGPAFIDLHVYIRLLAMPVKILSEKVKYGVNALVRIVLTISLELWGILAEDTFEHVWGHAEAIHIPHLIQKFC